MKTTKPYAPPIVEAITLNAEVGFASSNNIFETNNESYDIVEDIRWE